MKYVCDCCGACCTQLIIEIEELDLIREPRLIQVSSPFKLPEGMVAVDDNNEPIPETVPGFGAGAMLACGDSSPCQMLGSDSRCTIYPTRPNVCVAMQAGTEQCQLARSMKGLPPLVAINSEVQGMVTDTT